MTNVPRQALLILPDPSLSARLEALLAAEGWRVEWRSPQCRDILWDYGRYQVVVFQPSEAGEGEVHSLLANRPEHSSALILPVLSRAAAADVVKLMRDGVVDVLLTPFTDPEFIDTVNRVANHQNLYWENQLYRQELEKTNRELHDSLNILRMDQIAGRQVQKSLLPVSPLIFGPYQVDHRIKPSLYLSGDFVAYSMVFDRFLIFYFADVSGHGASSAFVTILLHFILSRVLRRHLYQHDIAAMERAPEGFIEHINRQLIAAGLEKHLTLFAGSIDTQTNLLRYAVAAQMPMPVMVVAGEASYLLGKGKPVGIFDDADWEINELVLPANFALHAISDGLLETLPGVTLADKERYLQRTAIECEADHNQLCARLGLNDNVEVADDMSLLSVVRRGDV